MPLLAALCLVQLGIAAWLALETPHNGWVWYSGGDATEYWTSEWAVSHLRLTQSIIGWGLPVLYAWIPLLTGTTLLAGLPVVVVFQVLVLVPLAVCLVWLVADRLGGRLYAWGATALWVAGPLLLLLGIRRHDYRLEFEQYFLAPHVYGLTNMADLPSLVLVLATVWATLRALDAERAEEWVLAGLVAGVTVGVKPANAFVLVAVAALLALTRSWRGALLFAAALVPALVVLAIWKQRGLGNLPLFSSGAQQPGAPSGPVAPQRYVPWDLHHLNMELRSLMEVFWSVRLLEWIAIAGAVAIVWRARARGIVVVIWFVMFAVIKGSSAQASVDTTSYFRLTEAGLPAYALMGASLPFLWPSLRRTQVMRAVRPLPRWALALAAAIGAAAPLAVVLGLRSQPPAYLTVRDNVRAVESPISGDLAASASGGRLEWRPVAGRGARVHYVVFRADRGTDGCTRPEAGAPQCFLAATSIGTTEATSFALPAGAGTYRVGLAANYLGAPNGSDLLLLGPPVVVR